MTAGRGPARRLARRRWPRPGWPTTPSCTATSPRPAGSGRPRSCSTTHPDLDGIVVASDLMAVGALRVLAALGRRVPDDVAVVGFDDLGVAERTTPPLTTVRQPVEEMAERATRLLLEQVDGPPARHADAGDHPAAAGAARLGLTPRRGLAGGPAGWRHIAGPPGKVAAHRGREPDPAQCAAPLRRAAGPGRRTPPVAPGILTRRTPAIHRNIAATDTVVHTQPVKSCNGRTDRDSPSRSIRSSLLRHVCRPIQGRPTIGETPTERSPT